MATITLDGIDPSIDGEYELVVPTTRDLMLFRKGAGVSPSEMGEIMAAGGTERLAVLAYTALRHAGKDAPGVIDKLLDAPLDQLSDLTDESEGEEEADLPPTGAPAEPETPSGERDSSGEPSSSDGDPSEPSPSPTGLPGSEATATSAPETSAT